MNPQSASAISMGNQVCLAPIALISSLLMIAMACPPLPASDLEKDAAARRLYEKMIQAMQGAETLSFVGHFDKEATGIAKTSCTYRVWLKKPNLFRVEVYSPSGEKGGVLVGDGARLWIYWPNGRPRFESVVETRAADATRLTSYITKPAKDASKISILHEAPYLGGGMAMPILDASIFHGHIDSLAGHIDAVRSLGNESVDGHVCRKIEVSFLGGQRAWRLWLSNEDWLPRKLKEIVRVDNPVITRERWSSLKIDEPIPGAKFRWSPPAGWRPWKLPDDESNWPEIGSQAPAFDLRAVGGERIRLSDYRGKTVWLNFWRLGCPPCVAEAPYLQEMHMRFKDAGLVLVAINVSDDRKLLSQFLRDKQITYLNVLDTSDDAKRVYNDDYGVGSIPMNCIVDASGAVVDVWHGYSQERTALALRRAGFTLCRKTPAGTR